MKKIFSTTLGIFLLFILQMTWFGQITFGGVKANILAIFIYTSSMVLDLEYSLGIAVIVGFLQDSLNGFLFGFNIFAYLLLAGIITINKGNIFKEGALIILAGAVIFSIVYALIYFMVIWLLGYNIGTIMGVASDIFYFAMYSAILSLPLYLWSKLIYSGWEDIVSGRDSVGKKI